MTTITREERKELDVKLVEARKLVGQMLIQLHDTSLDEEYYPEAYHMCNKANQALSALQRQLKFDYQPEAAQGCGMPAPEAGPITLDFAEHGD